MEIYRHLDTDEQAVANAILSVAVVILMHKSRFFFDNTSVLAETAGDYRFTHERDENILRNNRDPTRSRIMFLHVSSGESCGTRSPDNFDGEILRRCQFTSGQDLRLAVTTFRWPLIRSKLGAGARGPARWAI